MEMVEGIFYNKRQRKVQRKVPYIQRNNNRITKAAGFALGSKAYLCLQQVLSDDDSDLDDGDEYLEEDQITVVD
jgi:hypothetical protein